MTNITIIQGHPDPAGGHFCHALGSAYAEGAAASDHPVRVIDVANRPFELLRSKVDFESGAPPAGLQEAQEAIAWAEHLVIIYPLWLGSMPALLKGFFEQVFRPGFAFGAESLSDSGEAAGGRWKKRLRGRTAHVIVTMGMPALAYRWYFRAHGLKSFERNILSFVGIRPARATLIGLVESRPAMRAKKLEQLRRLGEQAR